MEDNKNWVVWATEAIEQAALEFGMTNGQLIYKLMSKELSKEQVERLSELQMKYRDRYGDF